MHARSTPGFIVNRIARPYYAESLQVLQEQGATPAMVDRALRGAGFRMGPCELMDLIGHDTNALVTQSVFEANFGDKRFQPSLVQRALVDGGRLGRKVGKGFYDGVPGAADPVAPPESSPPAVTLVGQGPLVDRLASWLAHRELPFATAPQSDWQGLALDGLELHLTDGRCAAELAHQRRQPNLAVMDWPLAPDRADGLAVAFGPKVSAEQQSAARALLRHLGWELLALRDLPGLVVARTIAMLINEASDAVWQGVCDAEGADTAMKLGVNYPAGPFEWLSQLGPGPVVQVLDGLFTSYRSERYRVSPLLRHRIWSA